MEGHQLKCSLGIQARMLCTGAVNTGNYCGCNLYVMWTYLDNVAFHGAKASATLSFLMSGMASGLLSGLGLQAFRGPGVVGFGRLWSCHWWWPHHFFWMGCVDWLLVLHGWCSARWDHTSCFSSDFPSFKAMWCNLVIWIWPEKQQKLTSMIIHNTAFRLT